MANPGFQRLQAHYDNFADWCNNVAREAGDLRGELSRELDQPLEDGPDWCAADKADMNALMYFSELESGFDNLLMMVPYDYIEAHDDEAADADIEEFIELRGRFHTALPFGEAERGWFLKAYKGNFEPSGSGGGSRLKVIGNQEARIVTAGVRQLVNGRDLARRWLAWRRETDEYADQGTLALARVTLDEIVRHTAGKP